MGQRGPCGWDYAAGVAEAVLAAAGAAAGAGVLGVELPESDEVLVEVLAASEEVEAAAGTVLALEPRLSLR